MVLGYGGFLHLKEQEYLIKLQNASLEDLRKQEIVKMRRQAGSCYSMAYGVSSAPMTAGTSLVVTGMGGRKLNVANRKLKMIQNELVRRGHAPHKRDWKDVTIPLAVVGIGSAVTSVVGAGFSSVHPVENVAPTGSSTATSITTEQVVYQLPSADGTGVDTATAQVTEVTSVSTGGTTGGTAASAVAEGASQHGPGQVVEHLIGEHTVDPIIERLFEGIGSAAAYDLITSSLGCKRYFGSTADLACNKCHEEITSGIIWHCCQCTDDNYDVCNRCYEKGVRCPCQTGLRWLQFSWNGQAYHPNRHAVSKRRQGYKFISCNKCSQTITQNRYFECADCDKGDGYDLCLACYSKGAYCQDPHGHALYSFTWAHSPNPIAEGAYGTSGGCTCSRCGKKVFQGVFYHCNQCSEIAAAGGKTRSSSVPDGSTLTKIATNESTAPGTFDLCSACYETGGGCADSVHVLRRYNAYRSSTNIKGGSGGDAFDGYCDVAGCNKPFGKERLWYQCTSCKVEGGDFAVCELCYSSGAGCADSGHGMTRVIRQD